MPLMGLVVGLLVKSLAVEQLVQTLAYFEEQDALPVARLLEDAHILAHRAHLDHEANQPSSDVGSRPCGVWTPPCAVWRIELSHNRQLQLGSHWQGASHGCDLIFESTHPRDRRAARTIACDVLLDTERRAPEESL